MLSRVLVVIVVLSFLFHARPISACSGVPYPVLEIFLTRPDGTFPPPAIANYNNDPNATCNGGQNPTTRMYFIDEDDTISFTALWNTMGNFSIQLSDSNVVNLTNQVALDAPWWSGPELLPMNQISLLAGSQTAIPSINPLLAGDPQAIIYATPADRSASDPVKQICVSAVPINGYYSNNSIWYTAESSWGLVSGIPGSYPAAPGTPLGNVFLNGNANEPVPDCFQMTCTSANFDGAPNTVVMDWLPQQGTIFSQSDTPPVTDSTRYVVKRSGYDIIDKDPKWVFLSSGVQWNWDATRVVETSESSSTISDMTGEVSCTFPVPSEPFFIEAKVTCLMLFKLADTDWVWYELLQTYDGADWLPADLPLNFDGTVDTSDPNVTECRLRLFGYFLRGSESGASQSTTLICVRDKTPPSKVLYQVGADSYDAEPPVLKGTTGDLLVESTNGSGSQDELSDNVLKISMVDNNPFAPYAYMMGSPYPDVSALKQPDPGYTGDTYGYDLNNLQCKILYMTELYDYGLGTDDSGNFPLAHNFYRPKRVWAQAAVPTLGTGAWSLTGHANGMNAATDLATSNSTPITEFNPSQLPDDFVEYAIYDVNGTNVTAAVEGRISADKQRFSVPSGAPPEPAYSITTFKIPIGAFREPLPLHLSGDPGNSAPGVLHWYPLLSDASANVSPEGSGDFDRSDVQAPDATYGPNAIKAMSATDFQQPTDDVTIKANQEDSGYSYDVDHFGTQTADPRMADIDTIPFYAGPARIPDGNFGKMGVIEVHDDEPPDIFLYVTDTKYNLTYRFGCQKHGDAARTALMDANGWCTATNTISAADTSNPSSFFGSMNLVGSLRNWDLAPKFNRPMTGGLCSVDEGDSYEPETNLIFGDKHFADYDAYFAGKETYDPSALYPGELAGCWVDEDSRLLFHVVTYDNCFTYYDGSVGTGTSQVPASLLQRRVTSDGERNGVQDITWEISDDGNLLGSSEAESFQEEYIFRNPNVDTNFDIDSSKACHVKVTARDYANNSRNMTVRFYVVGNQMRFRSIEEQRKGWKVW